MQVVDWLQVGQIILGLIFVVSMVALWGILSRDPKVNQKDDANDKC